MGRKQRRPGRHRTPHQQRGRPRRPSKKKPSGLDRLPRATLQRATIAYGLMAAAASAAALLITGLPLWACWLLGVNTTTLIAYSFDKSAARDRTWRVPEVVLHGLAATGGSPAAWIARPLFSHKTQKAGFARTLGVISLAQIAVGLAIVFLSWHG